jgi:large repetitive protein
MHTLFVVFLGFLAACGLTPTVVGPGHDSDSVPFVPTDADNDGSPEDEDCNDADAAMHPDAEEICDGKDNDCNGTADDTPDAVLYYRDADVDGWGLEGDTLLSCTPPKGYAAIAGDCDDGDAAVHPDTDDWCDGVDQDCDGTKDEDEVIWYLDADKDSYGADDAGTVSCEKPAGHVLASGDCDDANPDVHPGVADDTCDKFDDDCDGTMDEDAVLESWHYDLDDDSYGDEGFSIASCEQPYLGMITEGTDCNDDDVAVHPGAKEICNLVDDNCDESVDEGFKTISYWTDADNDNWGVGKPMDLCMQPALTAKKDGDCDDTDATINPAMGKNEMCGDKIDQDCDKSDC